MADDKRVKNVSADKARQGPKGTPIMWVLLGSLALVVVVWFFAGIWGSSTAPDATSQPQSGVTTGEPTAN
jgi:hypothetical protein